MDVPFFSIIIPTYNSALTLSISLDSVLHQNFSNYEVLVMDGASKDETVQIGKKYNDPRINVFSEPDNGIYDAMNKGIANAKGEWIYFLGSDDRLLNNNVLQDLHRSIQKTRCKVVYGSAKISGEAGWAKDGAIYDGEFSLEKLLRTNICHQAMLYHRSIFQKLGNYDLQYRVCADYDFNLRCFANYAFAYVPITLSLFNAGGASTTIHDEPFARDMWINIVKYFGLGIFKRTFTTHHRKLSRVRGFFLREKNVLLYVMVSMAIVYHRTLKVLDRA
jgi:glycosyltransferase involved in cell wall biosynthesis